jgi:hypothetical protein
MDAFEAVDDDCVSRVMASLTLDERARCGVLSTRFARLLAQPRQWHTVSLAGVLARVDDAALAALCARAGAALRCLNLVGARDCACSPAGLLAALQGAPGAALEELVTRSVGKPCMFLTVRQLLELRAACPALRTASLAVTAPLDSTLRLALGTMLSGMVKSLYVTSPAAWRDETGSPFLNMRVFQANVRALARALPAAALVQLHLCSMLSPFTQHYDSRGAVLELVRALPLAVVVLACT